MLSKVIVISKKGSERRNDLSERLAKGGITEYTIFDAIEPSGSNDDYIFCLTGKKWKKCGLLKNMKKNEARKAIYLSHLLVLNKAKINGEKSIMILEDDIKFTDNLIEKIKEQPKDSLITFFDTTWIEDVYHKKKVPYKMYPFFEKEYQKIDSNKYKVWCLGCYLINNVEKTYNLFIKQDARVVDKVYVNIQALSNCYLYMPSLATQDSRFFKDCVRNL